MERKQIHITQKQKKFFEKESKRTGITQAELMRRALDQYIERNK